LKTGQSARFELNQPNAWPAAYAYLVALLLALIPPKSLRLSRSWNPFLDILQRIHWAWKAHWSLAF